MRPPSPLVKRFLLVFTAAIYAILVVAAFTTISTTPAYASSASIATYTSPASGGCYSGHTDYPGAQIGDSNGYNGYDNDSPMVQANFNNCTDQIEILWENSQHDFYQVRWIRPGMSQESQYKTESNTGSNFANAHYNTVYQFIVEGCENHWYGSSCTNWSVRMYVHTNV